VKLIPRDRRRLLVLILSALFGILSALSFPAWSDDRPQVSVLGNQSRALELALEGQKYYNAGQFDEAAKLWQQAAAAYRQAGDREGTLKSFINTSQALQDLGLYPKACKTLLQALTVAHPDCSPAQLEKLTATLAQQPKSLSLTQAIGLRSLGDVLRRQGMLKQSQAVLQLSLAVAENSPQESATLLSLGNTDVALGNQIRDYWDYEQVTETIERQSLAAALEPYGSAFKSYHRAAALAIPITKIQAQLNHFSLLLDIQKWWVEQTNRRIASWSRLKESKSSARAKDFLSQLRSQLTQEASALQSQISSNLANLTPSRATVYAQLHFAQNLLQLQQPKNAQPLLNAARKQARTLKDRRAEAYALGYLGQLHSAQGQLRQATQLTRQALMLAQEQNISGDAREITYLWQSQLGRLLRKQGDERGAIAAYAAAFNTLGSLRSDLNANNRDVQFDFRQEVKPVYLELADLLLRSPLSEQDLNSLVVLNSSNTTKSDPAKTSNQIELARRVIESLQLAELDNFFQDPCSEPTDVAVQIDDIDSQAAVIYPIVFPDRLETIVSLPGKPLRANAIAVSESKVNQTLDRLYDTLYNESVDNSAINIFRTIPLNPQEVEENIQQLLPIFAQLYDWLIQPFEPELAANQIKTLVFVLNDRLQRVPMAALYNGQQYLIEKYGIASVPSLQLVDSKQLPREQIKVLAAGVSQQIQVRGQIFPALSKVPEELDQIEQAFPKSQLLLNREFTATNLQNRIAASTFPVVHLATHGLFSSNPENTFIITGDRGSISINQLSQLLSTGNTKTPELLVLSACETATGDERAILGLAGVAVRSGARSTLATLWSVGDASTAQLMGQFYQQLKNPGVKKLAALRDAQLSLLESLRVRPPFQQLQDTPPHPYYWAPYVLVGNWQ
jgi:CHAT domain-containing protein